MFECFLCRREWGRFSPYIFLFSSLSSIYNCWCARGALFDCAFKPEFKFKFRFLLEFRFDDDLFRQINKWHVQSVNLSSCRRAELKISARKSLCNGEIPRARRLRWKSPDGSRKMPNAQMLSVGKFMARLLILSAQSACHISGEHISLLCDIANAFCLTQ